MSLFQSNLICQTVQFIFCRANVYEFNCYTKKNVDVLLQTLFIHVLMHFNQHTEFMFNNMVVIYINTLQLNTSFVK